MFIQQLRSDNQISKLLEKVHVFGPAKSTVYGGLQVQGPLARFRLCDKAKYIPSIRCVGSLLCPSEVDLPDVRDEAVFFERSSICSTIKNQHLYLRMIGGYSASNQKAQAPSLFPNHFGGSILVEGLNMKYSTNTYIVGKPRGAKEVAGEIGSLLACVDS